MSNIEFGSAAASCTSLLLSLSNALALCLRRLCWRIVDDPAEDGEENEPVSLDAYRKKKVAAR